MQAIVCEYVAPTNTRGAAVKVRTQRHPRGVRYPWRDADDPSANFLIAATTYACDRGWPSQPLVRGVLPDGSHVFVIAPQEGK